ncbi:MAG TPA: AI-2E family transporter [Verrucomicrobiota bacterium]|nr:AI-2E family transporter [Verrucomicrobiota bacterium]
MNLPPPSEHQARIIWAAITGLAIAIIVALVVGFVWGMGRVLDVLSPVLWPIAVAAVLACLLDPVVDFFERRRVPRTRAIGMVFLIALFLIMGVFSSVVPRLVVETQDLANKVPTYVAKLEGKVIYWANNPPAPLRDLLKRFGVKLPAALSTSEKPAGDTNAPPDLAVPPVTQPEGSLLDQIDRETAQKAAQWVGSAIKSAGGWLGRQFSRLTGFFGVIAGLALIPIYLFYLLAEKRFIAENWTVYLPVRDSQFKEELVFVIRSINDYLIAFFRGQVLVAMCDGVLYGIGFAIIGLPYAFLIGAVAMIITIIPYLGAIVTCVAALLIAVVNFGDWQHPLLVIGVFAVVQGIEGYVLQPKILGDRVGLHPMVIIVAIMTGTTLLGGILGGLLAIPLAAALRVIMFRYVWKRESRPE